MDYQRQSNPEARPLEQPVAPVSPEQPQPAAAPISPEQASPAPVQSTESRAAADQAALIANAEHGLQEAVDEVPSSEEQAEVDKAKIEQAYDAHEVGKLENLIG